MCRRAELQVLKVKGTNNLKTVDRDCFYGGNYVTVKVKPKEPNEEFAKLIKYLKTRQRVRCIKNKTYTT